MVDFQERDTTRGLDEGSREGENGEGEIEAQGSEDEEHARGHDHDHEHGHGDLGVDALGAAVVTVSSSRTLEDDPSGDALASAFENAGHAVVTRELVEDAYDNIQRTVSTLAGRGDVDLVVTTGGTGVTPDDVTPEAVRPLFDKELPGFGELFRRRSEEKIGARTIASRATAGIAGGVPVFCLPGSENAVRLGVDELILPEAEHLVGLARHEEEEDEE